MSCLTLTDITVRYGSLAALDDVSVEMEEKRVTSLVGPNGAGKSTLLDVASGFSVPAHGTVRLGDELLTGGSHRFAEAGIRRTFQTPRVMPDLTVLDNVMVGTHTSVRSSLLADLFDTVRRYRGEQRQRAAAMEAIDRVGLGGRAADVAGALSYGQVRLLELARALAGQPRLLLLDEPAAGLNQEETWVLGDLLVALANNERIGVVLVEHNLGLVKAISEVIHVLNFGRVIASGDAEAVVEDPAVIEAYTGTPEPERSPERGVGPESPFERGAGPERRLERGAR